ncbi:hypothetical protein PPYR_14308 [Photinus pyralis]|uniref:PLAT domain-containing protein n=1 Tax=Photinus pyralis TaxID=7054 RepID=A0A5N4A510_PHOPY|nr:hypothetical protein PPYR_14308 [Photinus pyralis]
MMDNRIFIFILLLIGIAELLPGDDDDLLPTFPSIATTSTIAPPKRCEGELAIKRCQDVRSPSDDPNWKWHRRNKYVVQGTLEAACDPADYVFNWTLINADKNMPRKRRVRALPQFWNRSLVIINPFEIDVGTYHVKLEVKQLSTNQDRYAYCLVTIVSCPPRAIIDLMYYKDFRRLEQKQRVRADMSINFDNPPGYEHSGLSFDWTCEDFEDNKDKDIICICCLKNNAHQTTATLYLYTYTFPKRYYVMNVGAKAMYTLTVTTSGGGQSFLPFIVSLPSSLTDTDRFIKCVKNCFGVSNCQESIILKSYGNVPNLFYGWHTDKEGEFEGLTAALKRANRRIHSITGTVLIDYMEEVKLEIPAHTFKPGTELVIWTEWNEIGLGTLLGDYWVVKGQIRCLNESTLTGCKVSRIYGDGGTLTSLYEIICTYSLSENGGAILTVYREENSSEYLLATGYSGPIHVAVAYYKGKNSLFVKLLDVSERQAFTRVYSVDGMQPYPSDKTPLERLQSLKAVYLHDQNPMNESLPRLLRKQDYEAAIQVMHLVIGAIDAIPLPENKTEAALLYEPIEEHLVYLMTGLPQVELHLIDDHYLLLGVLNHVSNLNEKLLTAKVFSGMVTTAQHIANTFKKYWAATLLKEKLKGDFRNIIKYLMAIVLKAMANKMDDLKVSRPEPNANFSRRDDAFNFVDDSLILDPKYEEKLAHYQRISREGIDALLEVAQIYGQDMFLGEDLKTITWEEACTLSVARWSANQIHEINYAESPATVNFDKNAFNVFKRTEVVVVIMKFVSIDPLWWDLGRRFIRPPYLVINLFAKNEKLPAAEGGIIVKFTFSPENMTQASGDFVVPENQMYWSKDIKEKAMIIHRVDVTHGTALLYKFNLESDSHVLNIVTTVNRLPLIDDFDRANVKQVGKDTGRLVERFPKEFLSYGDAWIYIAVLPSKAMSKDEETRAKLNVSYTVGLLTSGCMYWSFPMTEWIPHGCSASGDISDTEVECVCDHHSMFAPLVLPPSVISIPYVPPVKFYIEMQTCDVIFVFVLISVFIYCCVLCLGFSSTKIVQKKVYYGGDNVISDRFAYLVCVKTGSYSNTTSNIGVKFIGSNSTSRMHIINYPDPDFKLLRLDNEDWFVLTSENYLGELTEVMLWHDCVGSSPDWFCEYVSVVDLQTRQEYCFSIHKWISVVLSKQRFLVAKVSSTLTERLNTSNMYRRLLDAMKDHTWNILQSFQDSDLSYTKRITLMLSIVLTTFSFALCAYGTPSFHNYDVLDIGHIDFYPSIAIAAVCSGTGSFFVHLAYVMLFRKAYYRNVMTGETFLFKVAWTLLILTILAASTFLTLCGFFVGVVSSTLWTYSSIAALIQAIALLEGIYVVFRNLVFPSPTRLSDRVKLANAVVDEAENQRNTLFEKFGDFLFRPFLKDKYRALTNEEWRYKKQRELERKDHINRITDALIYVPFMILLFIIIFFYRDSMRAISNNDIRDIFSGHAYPGTASLASINNTEGFYAYITNSLWENAFTKSWYGMEDIAQVKMIKGLDNVVLGAVRLRQHRLANPCSIPSSFAKSNLTCVPTYTHADLDQNDYSRAWGPNKPTASRVNPWRWATEAMHIFGKRSNYASGGYVMDLSEQKGITGEMIESITTYNWIDKQTRLLVIEFLAYNANYNVFHFVKLVIEKTASGYCDPTMKIFSLRLFTTNRAAELLFYALIVLSVMFALAFIYNVMKRILTKTSAIKLWDIVDCVIIVLVVVNLILFFIRLYWLMTLFHKMESVRPDEYINYYDLLYVGEQLFVVESLTLFFITFRIWKMLDFVGICGTCMRTLRAALPELLSVGLVHLIILISWALMCHMIFGKSSNSFRDFQTSLATIVLFTKDRSHLEYHHFWNVYGAFMIYIYTIVTLIMFGFYFAIIRAYYSRCKKRDSGIVEFYSFHMYIRDNFWVCVTKIKKVVQAFRLKAGADSESPPVKPSSRVYPKGVADRYGDVVAVSGFDIQAMSLAARACLHNMGYKNKGVDQSVLMRKILYHVGYRAMVQSPRYLSFRSLHRDPSNMLVSEAKMVAMERIVAGLLEKGERERSDDTSIVDDGERQAQTLDEMLYAIKLISKVISNISLVKILESIE